MSHKYNTRLNNISNSYIDKYLDYDTEFDTDSESTSSSITTILSELTENYSVEDFSDLENENQLEEFNMNDEKMELNKFLSKAKKELGSNNNIFNLFLEGSDSESNSDSNDEHFLKNIDPEEKEELLRLESQISKINHKRVPLRYQILKSHLPIHIKAIAIKKLESIEKMDESSPEYYKISNWIDGLLKIPFNKYINTSVSIDNSSEEEISNFLINIKNNLDESVYGHLETKSTLLEIVSSWITNPNATPTVIGLQGPPGTGKTTLIKNGVAKALKRPFSMITLGGATDASYLEGHGYTYEGSTWGKLVSILIETGCMNPIIFMDELDKVSETKHGEEIIGVLTHLIDYSQNDQIQDRYFSGIPLDFSKALFIFSFNDEEKLNPILKDRIHVIRTDSFTRDAKYTIAKNYLIPQLLSNVKFNNSDILFTDETIYSIIDKYTNSESGVRNLKRVLESIIMKLNTIRLTYKNPISSSPNNLLIPYYLNDFKIPMTITNSIAEKLLIGSSIVSSNNYKLPMMYI